MRIRRKHIIGTAVGVGLLFLASRSWAVAKTANAAASLMSRFAFGGVKPDWKALTLTINIVGIFQNTRQTAIPLRAIVMDLYAVKGERRALIGTVSHWPGAAGDIKPFQETRLNIPMTITPAQLSTLVALYGKNVIQLASAGLKALRNKQSFSAGISVNLQAQGRIVTVENINIPFTENFSFSI